MAVDSDFEEYRRQQEDLQAINEKMSASLKNMLEHYSKMNKFAASLQHINQKIALLEKERLKLQADLNTGTAAEQAQKQADFDLLEKKIEYEKKLSGEYEEQYKLLGKANVQTNLLVAASKDLWKWSQGYSKYFVTQDKAIRMSALNMGVLKTQSKGYWENITRASLQTNILGASSADLAKMQANYSEELGRMVGFSEKGNVAMAEIAKGTGLGEEGATQMAAQMNMFGISVIGARDKVQETVDLAHKMGMNATKVLKNLLQNLKLGQMYNFKGGVKGLKEMAAYSEKFKMNMQSIAGFADKVMNPEGAVEVASQLQVLGGAWSQLGDPFRLMYESRNDMESFTKSIAEATAGTFRFNRATGEIDKSSLELNRLREIAKVTGISFEELSSISHRMAQIKNIDLDISPNLKGDKAARELIENTATWDKDKKGWVINIGAGADGEKLVKNLSTIEIQDYLKQKATLAERAKQAQTFDEQWKNIVETVKSSLLPLMKGIADGLTGSMNKLVSWANKSGAFEKIYNGAKFIGDKLGWFLDSFTGVITGLGLVLAGWTILKAATWLANGIAFGQGFILSTGGMFGPGGALSRLGPLLSGGAGMLGRGVSAGVGAAGALAAPAAIMAGGGLVQNMEGDLLNTGADKAGRDNIVGGGMGAAADFFKGSIFAKLMSGRFKDMGMEDVANVATMNMYGFTKSIYDNILNTKQSAQPSIQNDFISRPGEDSVPFSKNDTIFGFKKDGPLGDLLSGIGNVGNNLGDKANNAVSNIINIVFEPLEIKVNFAGAGMQNMSFEKDPILARELSRIIQLEIRKAIGGGKYNANTGSNP